MSDKQPEIDELRKILKSYTPGASGIYPKKIPFPEALNIGIFGKTGCGKTSLINSFKYASTGKLRRTQWLQVAGQERVGAQTLFRRKICIAPSIGVVDNRGMDEPLKEEAIEELKAQLDGKRGYSEVVEWGGTDPETRNDDIDLEEVIGCAVFVFSAEHDVKGNINGLPNLVHAVHIHHGRYPVAVITHVDSVKKEQVEKLKLALRMTGVSDVFEVANLTEEKRDLENEYQLNLLSLLDRCMNDGDETIVFQYHKQKDQAKKQAAGKIRQQQKELEEREQRRLQEEEEARAYERKLQEEREKQEEQLRREREIAEMLSKVRIKAREEKEEEIKRMMEENNQQSSCVIS